METPTVFKFGEGRGMELLCFVLVLSLALAACTDAVADPADDCAEALKRIADAGEG